MKRLVPLLFVVLVLVLVGSGCGSKTPPANASLGDTWERPADKMVMVYVPAGEFEMGSTDGPEYEQPVHTVGLDGFWIDRTEVTNAQYLRCEEAGKCSSPEGRTRFARQEYHGDKNYDDYPVSHAVWRQAEAYCTWAGARFLTEAEWEYAARGPESFKYPWGDSEPTETLLNYDGNVDDFTEVGSYSEGASWCGALDMAGNVQEWVADPYTTDYYADSPSRNPPGPTHSTSQRIVRGGSFKDRLPFVRAASRIEAYITPFQGSPPSGFGFRCAQAAE